MCSDTPTGRYTVLHRALKAEDTICMTFKVLVVGRRHCSKLGLGLRWVGLGQGWVDLVSG